MNESGSHNKHKRIKAIHTKSRNLNWEFGVSDVTITYKLINTKSIN